MNLVFLWAVCTIQQTFVLVKTYWSLQHVFNVTFFCLPRRLKEVLKTSWRHNCKTSCKHVLKTSWRRLARRLENILGRRIANKSWRCLEDVFKRSWKTKGVTLKASSRRLEDVLENKKYLLGDGLVDDFPHKYMSCL